MQFEKPHAMKAAKFLLLLIGFYILFTLIFRFIFSIQLIEFWTAQITLKIFEALGYSGTIVQGEPVQIIFPFIVVHITELCTGILEFSIVASAILATLEVSWKKRIIGALGAGIITGLFNFARITIVLLALISLGISEAELAHDVLFRISLLFVIIGYYALWFYLSVKK
ncbi:MAG: exosortase/archaeosortase family protein [archaeon]|nr:exosortase/archaeosortase family protein [archaeon]